MEAEINNVDGCPEPLPKEEPKNDKKEATPSVISTEEATIIPEPAQSDPSAVSDKDKELTWEKIAAEFTEDEEDVVDIPSTAPKSDDVQLSSNVDMIIEKTQETVVETEIVKVSASETEPSDKVFEDVSVEKITDVVNQPLEEPHSVEGAPETDPIKSTPESEVIETDTVVDEPADSAHVEPAKELEDVVEEPQVEKPPEEPVTEEEEDQDQVEDVVEITELKPEEATVAEAVEGIEYTVIEADEVETNEIIEEHIAAETNTTETVVIINPDQSQTEITIEQIDESDKNDEIYIINKDSEASVDDPGEPMEEVKEVKPRKQRGRKPIADIPLHVLGRDITKPTEGVSNGGRTMPKPRLGVKVPYRNLTSQIVSKEEIEKEIMERFKLKQEQNSTTSGDILFARKLTQRLAKKLIPSEREKTAIIKPSEPRPEATTSVTNQNLNQSESEIKNNSDLIAILEGEGEEIPVAKQKSSSETSKEPISKNTEKEIALQQLKELPVSKNKIFKSKSEEEKKPPAQSPKTQQAKNISPEGSPTKPTTEAKSQKEVEPRLKTGMVIKTYTRKRKSSELETILPPKKSVVVATAIKSEDSPSTNVYVTKSSRVIKRKVIWDPDEVPSKSPVKSPKPETSPPKSPVKVAKTETPPTAKSAPEKKVPVPVKKVVSKSPPPKKPKRLTEVDKLLMDEGAVNMLYDVKTNEDSSGQDKLKMKNSNKSVISLDKAHKELMSKTKVIRNELQQNTNKEIQKQLRKKEVTPTTSPPKKETPSPSKKEAQPVPITRKKSKDSTRSSVHSPPSSPAYNAAEASRIIRRHSSSSFSSTDGMNEEDEGKMTRKKVAAAAAASSSSSAETPKKKVKKNSDAKPAKEDAKNNNNTVPETKTDKEYGQYKTFVAMKKNKLVAIKLNKENTYFTDQVLKELTSCLKELGKDDECHVVSFTSNNNESFCLGVDYSCLVVEEEQARKKKATELATLVKDFLRCLLNFPKVLVAGIQGECVGLGVTMLPLFDMVIASDTSTFFTPYAKLGSIPEAGFLLTVPHLSSHGLASELLYTGQVVKADDAFRRGLVTRLCWPEKYSEELKSMLALVASQSIQSIMATKQQLRHHLVQSTESALNSTSKALIEHWTSPECQSNFLK